MNAFQEAMHYLAQGAVNIDRSYKTVEPGSHVHNAMHAVCKALPVTDGHVSFVIGDAQYRKMTPYVGQTHADQWIVTHPSNNAILAYCESEADAQSVVQCLKTLGEHFEAP